MANRQVSVYIEREIVKEMAQCNYNQFFYYLQDFVVLLKGMAERGLDGGFCG